MRGDTASGRAAEVWESALLQAVVATKHSDPRTGTIAYHLANLTLGEPPADLFMIPADYTVIGFARQGGPGGRRGGVQ